jgi:hypothetical protein
VLTREATVNDSSSLSLTPQHHCFCSSQMSRLYILITGFTLVDPVISLPYPLNGGPQGEAFAPSSSCYAYGSSKVSSIIRASTALQGTVDDDRLSAQVSRQGLLQHSNI